MKSIYFIAFLCFPILSKGQVVDIVDANFLERLVAEGVDLNGDWIIQQSEADAVDSLNISNSFSGGIDNKIEDLSGIEAFRNLKILICYYNLLDTLDLSGNLKLEKINCANNRLTSIDFSANGELKYISCWNNFIDSLDVSNCAKLEILHCCWNDMSELNIFNNSKLVEIKCCDNLLTNLDLSNCPNIKELACHGNELTELNFNSPELIELDIARNDLYEFDFTKFPKLSILDFCCNNIEYVDLTNNKNLVNLISFGNNYRDLDLSYNKQLKEARIGSDFLTTINVKNGSTLDFFYVNRVDTTSRIQICVDSFNYDLIFEKIENYNVEYDIFTDCLFPDKFGEFNNKLVLKYSYAETLLDCPSENEVNQLIKFRIEFNGESFIIFPKETVDDFFMLMPNGSFKLRPELEYDSIFNIDPKEITIDFNDSNTIIQNFCITPKGLLYEDLSINIIPIDIPRPGFESTFKLKFSNNGNINSDGEIAFIYPSEFMDFISSDSDVILLNDTLLLSYIDLAPFEDREIFISFDLNSPMDFSPLFGGEMLNVSAKMYSEGEDINLSNNCTTLELEVVNSYDPNDKVCLQGNVVLDSMLGEFLNYKIRFENTGTADAINIIIEDDINPIIFDISSIRIIDSSHPMQTLIRNNRVSFVFDNIYLPYDDENNDGYLVFEIRTWDNLFVGDTLANEASIFFDYNFPIITNNAISSIVEDLDGDGFHNLEDCDDNDPNINPIADEIYGNIVDENCDGEILSSINSINWDKFSIFPNPVSETIFIEVNDISDYDFKIFGFTGELLLSGKVSEQISVASLQAGIFVIKFFSEESNSSESKRFIVYK